MKTKIYTGLALLVTAFAFSQAGIGTVTPQATLDVVGKPTDAATLDGIIGPRLTGAQLRAKTYTASQLGAEVYVTAADPAPAGQTIDVTAPGYYYFDGVKWINSEGRNLYNSNGSLGSPRTVTLNGYNLIFAGTNQSTTISQSGGLNQTALAASATKHASVSLTALDNNSNSLSSRLIFQVYPEATAQIIADNDATGLSLSTHSTTLAAPITFVTSAGGNTAGTEKMRITGTGNLGIARSIPTEKLHINGITRIEGLPLNGTLNAHNTLSGGGLSATQNQTFTAIRTVVSNADGVLGYVSGLPIAPSGFEKIPGTTATNYYWRLVGAPSANYGVGGKYSVDASWNPADFSETVAGYTYSTVLTASGLTLSDLGAKGAASFTTGTINSVSGDASSALGAGNTVSGQGAFATGFLNRATGEGSFVAGNSNQATAASAIAMGINNIASAQNGVAIGQANEATAQGALALGNTNKATQTSAVAMGQQNTASAAGTLALGNTNQATATSAVAIGQTNQATGAAAVVIGNSSIASGANSVAIGNGLTAPTTYAVAMGAFNKAENLASTERQMFVIGNGTSATAASRSDAFTVLKSGKVGIDIDNFENTTSSAKLQVNGQIKLVPETVAPACNATNEGTIQYFKTSIDTGEFRGCKQTSGVFNWVNL